jgi:hypothetical protein
MKRIVRILWWTLWTFSALATSAMTMIFVSFRPTTYVGDRLVDQRSVDLVALLSVSFVVVVLGFGARLLVRKPLR